MLPTCCTSSNATSLTGLGADVVLLEPSGPMSVLAFLATSVADVWSLLQGGGMATCVADGFAPSVVLLVFEACVTQACFEGVGPLSGLSLVVDEGCLVATVEFEFALVVQGTAASTLPFLVTVVPTLVRAVALLGGPCVRAFCEACSDVLAVGVPLVVVDTGRFAGVDGGLAVAGLAAMPSCCWALGSPCGPCTICCCGVATTGEMATLPVLWDAMAEGGP